MVGKRSFSLVDSVESEDALRYTKRSRKSKESPFFVTPKVTITGSHLQRSSPSSIVYYAEEGTSEKLAVSVDSTAQDLTELIKTFCQMYDVPEGVFALTVRIGNNYYNKRKGPKGNGLLIVLSSLILALKFEDQGWPSIEWILEVFPIPFQKKDVSFNYYYIFEFFISCFTKSSFCFSDCCNGVHNFVNSGISYTTRRVQSSIITKKRWSDDNGPF